jgi:hypothetical protein
MPLDRLLAFYPALNRLDIANCINYCGSQQCLKDKPQNFCGGCSLDKREQEAPRIFLRDLEQLKEFCDSPKDHGSAYLGTFESFIKETPLDVWKLAADLKI